MPLSDWLGGSRQDGFACQLQVVASRLGLKGEIVDGVGYYEVWGRNAFHPTIVSLDESVLVRVLSNVRFPPGRVPQQVVVMLMERTEASRYYSWDVHNNSRWACFYIHTRLALPSFGAPLLKSALEESLVEVGALDDMLGSGGRLDGPVGPNHSPGLSQNAPALCLPPPDELPPDEVHPYVYQLVRRLLGGPRSGD